MASSALFIETGPRLGGSLAPKLAKASMKMSLAATNIEILQKISNNISASLYKLSSVKLDHVAQLFA